MSGDGRPAGTRLDAKAVQGLRVAVVATRWHAEITDALLASALAALGEMGVAEPTVLRVPGAFELPVAAKALAATGHHAVICLGLVLRGGTPHFDYVCQGVTQGLAQVAVSCGIPVGFGVLTCDTVEQAVERSGLPGSSEDKGREAAEAAVETAVLLRGLRMGEASELHRESAHR
ncbi:MAG: 6,7-dimethyl-8-ribityllumazine synthase [Frankiales bacterium]|nr:6,7-dimethyl-8-ribityllumazine synthase [Frankiales bacterium]